MHPTQDAREKKTPFKGKAVHSCELACLCRAELHGSAAAHAAQPARAAQPSQASTSRPGVPVSASKPGRKREEDAMQKLIRQRTAGGRVQVPRTMQQGMAQVSAPLSPNILAEPYKYESHPVITSRAMSADCTESLCAYGVALQAVDSAFTDLHIMAGGGDVLLFFPHESVLSQTLGHQDVQARHVRQGRIMLGGFQAYSSKAHDS